MARAQKTDEQSQSSRQFQHGKHRLDALDPERVGRHLVMFQPTDIGVEHLMIKAHQAIPGLANTADVLEVFRHNRDGILAFARKSRFNPAAPEGEAMIAMLLLNKLGAQHLALGTINAAKPDLRLIAGPGERPAAVYLWAVFAPGPLAASMALMMQKLSSAQFDGVDIYARPRTADGIRFSEVLGFTKGTVIEGLDASDVWVFPRRVAPPLYDSYQPGAAPGEIGVTIARTFEDLNRVVAIRSAVYIGEQECPYDEEYDGNDLAATHLLAYIGDEPVGCLRIRYFADFAKIERLAIRKEFRKTRAAFQLVRAGFKLCGAKGYTKVYGHSQTRLVNFWSRFGFRVPENARHFVFSDFDYVEIVADIPRDPQAVTLQADPYTIIRPEGRWHKPGILEKSAARAVTRPSVTAKQ